MIRVAVVEDEEIYARQLGSYIERYEGEEGERIELTVYKDGDEITAQYQGQFDVMLMDIRMRFMNGISAAEEIRKMDSEVVIIFITNMAQYAIRGYEVDALDYILKPIEYFTFSQKLKKAIRKIKNRSTHYITFSQGDSMQKLAVENISYIESVGHNLVIMTESGKYVFRGVLKDMEAALEPYGFFRVNKGYLVNMKYVNAVSEGYCKVQNIEISISRAKKKFFLQELTRHIGYDM